MILSDVDIADELDAENIVISPEPTAEQIQPASLDIRMGDTLFDVTARQHVSPVDGTFTIYPWRFYLSETMESVAISNGLTATIDNRSTFAREGLFPHLAAGRVDPGWSGVLTLEMINVNMRPVTVDVGERIVQLVFDELRSESSGYDGAYQGATSQERSQREGESVVSV